MPNANVPDRRGRSSLGGLLWWVFFEAKPGTEFAKKFAHGLVPFLLTVGLSVGCQRLGLYERFEWADLDALQRASRSVPATGIALVEISDEDYEKIFNRTSPLAPLKVIDLLAAVCAFDPQVVGVDLITSDWSPADVSAASEKLGQCPLVWIADVSARPGSSDANRDTTSVVLGKVLGRSPPMAPLRAEADGAPCWAMSVFQPDPDGVIRRYTTHYPAALGDEPIVRPYQTLAWVLTRKGWRPSVCIGGDIPNDWTRAKKIPFGANSGFSPLSAELVLDSYPKKEPLYDTLKKEFFASRPIVIVGGAYRHARDEHRTPIGMLSGSEILASAVLTERDGNAVPDVAPAASMLIDLAVGGILLAFVTWLRLNWFWATLLSTLLAVGAALGISFWLYDYLGYFLGVFGAMAGIVLGVVVEAVEKPFKAWLRELRSRIADLRNG